MTLKSSPLVSNGVSAAYSSSDGGSIKTNDGTKQVSPLTSKSKCAFAACVVGGVAGVVIVILGTINLFGSVGSIGFIASVAGGGILAVIAIGGVIWTAISNCKRSNTQARGNSIGAKEVKNREDEIGVSDHVNDNPYSVIGLLAIDFARQELSKHLPNIIPYVFVCGWRGAKGTHQPVNKEIALLTNLYWDIYVKEFIQALKNHQNDPWAQNDVIQAADACMKISYAISCLTLDDLSGFTKSLAQKGIQRTYTDALIEQDSYLYRTFFWCTGMYHWARGEIQWCKGCREIKNDEEGLIYPEEGVSEEHKQLFYQENTIQSSWRILYNDYCDRIRIYVKESELKNADGRHVNWTQKDEDAAANFKRIPDTLPT